MTSELEDESYVIQIRAKLNQQKKLAIDYHEELNISVKDCLQAIKKLQQNALDKLKSKTEFTQTGLATLKIRTPMMHDANNKLFDVKIKIASKAQDLADIVAKRLTIDALRIKLVCAGKLLNPSKTLSEQNVPNGATVMALVMMQSVDAAQKENGLYDRVHKIRTDAELLINDNDQSDFLSLEDQDGNAIHLPKTEKKSLLMALTLYEKGKVALRKDNFEEALLLFLEADNDFRSCNSQLLTVVDNYALLNLDIVWCYLCLKNINQLPDAEQRLRLCGEKFQQSYGENMHRAATIRGTQRCSEKALLLRLHLLKAVLYFHQNKREEARVMFQVVETELQSLKVDDASLTTLLEFGFELSESRIALRATSNNVEAAIDFINNRREMLTANEKKSKREKTLYKKIGFEHADEVHINVDLVDQLVEMGYSESLAAMALKKSKNNILDALNELQNNHDQLKTELTNSLTPSEDLIDKLIDLGFHKEAAVTALRQTINNFEEAVEFLVAAQNNNSYDSLLTEQESLNAPLPTSTETVGTVPSGSEQPAGPSRKRAKNDRNNAKKEMMDILYKSFSKDMKTNSDTYLDLSLVEEAAVLDEYKKLLNM
ncbi:NEDD8 ultimate buster 1-like isoform X2 [Armigeres subalbatus]|uniref:NEDD8 ultimate buster 1-like isoform X2 n=1 Tax=Armigeres subalbatus TaxID=124917 RepID=UPI002ECFB195